MSEFLQVHRADLIRRCAAKAAKRPRLQQRGDDACATGIPVFLEQLQRTLEAELRHEPAESVRISGAAGGEAEAVSEMGVTATEHGRQLLELGYSVDQVVHGYGDLCQAITDLAFERNAPFAVGEFRTLNRCLDNAIASAVVAFSLRREAWLAAQTHAQADEQSQVLLLSLRSSLATATYAVVALELGSLPLSGSTGAVLKNCLAALRSKLGGPTPQELQE